MGGGWRRSGGSRILLCGRLLSGESVMAARQPVCRAEQAKGPKSRDRLTTIPKKEEGGAQDVLRTIWRSRPMRKEWSRKPRADSISSTARICLALLLLGLLWHCRGQELGDFSVVCQRQISASQESCVEFQKKLLQRQQQLSGRRPFQEKKAVSDRTGDA